MTHELRLVSFEHLDYGPMTQPYCPCGWVGMAAHYGDPGWHATQYRTHLNLTMDPRFNPEENS